VVEEVGPELDDVVLVVEPLVVAYATAATPPTRPPDTASAPSTYLIRGVVICSPPF
jgi:hypothetical protein